MGRFFNICRYHLVMTNIAMENHKFFRLFNSLPWKDPPFLIGKPSIPMRHLYHGYVSHNQRVINVFHEHSWHELKSTWLGIFRLGAFHEILGCGRWQSSKKQRGCGAHFQASARAACNSPSFCNDLFFSVCLMSCRGRPTRYQHVSGVISINLIVLFYLSLAYFII